MLPEDHVLSAIVRPKDRWDVLAFIGSLSVGGCEQHLAHVFPRLVAAGLKVGVVTFRRGGPLENVLTHGGVGVFCLNRTTSDQSLPFQAGIVVLDIARLLRSGNVGVAHFFLPGAYIVGGLGAVLARHSNTAMSRRSLNDYQSAHPWATRIEHHLHRRTRVLIANARPVQAQLLAEGAPKDRTVLLYSGVDLDRLANIPPRSVARERFGLASDMLVMAIVANLIPYKGHADLLEALGLIASQIQRRWVLLVAGRDDGPGMELKKRAEALGIGSNIRWLGLIDNVNLLWRAADIGVLASHQEGLPNSLLEAMAMGVAMVATRVGGVSDIATDGKECLLVGPRDPIGMASALLRLAHSEELRSQLALAATTRVRTCFALQTCVERYRRLYDLMLQHNDVTNGAHVCRQFNDGAANEIPAASLQI